MEVEFFNARGKHCDQIELAHEISFCARVTLSLWRFRSFGLPLAGADQPPQGDLDIVGGGDTARMEAVFGLAVLVVSTVQPGLHRQALTAILAA